MSQLIKRLLVKCGWTKAPQHTAGWSMQFREILGCKALVMGNGKALWIVDLSETAHGSCYKRSTS
jgi:hypothetical protein